MENAGLNAAIRRAAAMPRARMRNVLAKARHHRRQMIAALIRTIFAEDVSG